MNMLQQIIRVSSLVDLTLNFCVRIVNAVALIGHCCDEYASRMTTYACAIALELREV